MYESKNKLSKGKTFTSSTSSPLKSNSTSASSSGNRKSLTGTNATKKSPTMSKTTSSPPSGGAKGGAANTGLGLSRTMEMMMDKICPMNLA